MDKTPAIQPEQHVTDLIGQEGVVTVVSGEYAYVVSGMWHRADDLIPIDDAYFGDPRQTPTTPPSGAEDAR